MHAESVPVSVPVAGTARSGYRRTWPICRDFARGERRDSNPRPPGPQPGALPTELRPPSDGESSGDLGSFQRGLLALTFDDGPDPRGTPAVLEALAAADVRATFFVLGERVERNPALLARVLDDGHDVEVHGYEHLRHPEYSRESGRGGFEPGARGARRARASQPTRWRIPWGHLAEFTAELASDAPARARRLDARHARLAWRQRGRRCSSAATLTHGGIVLAHDGIGPGARRQTAQQHRGADRAAGRTGTANRASSRVRSRPVGRSRSRWGIPSSILG